MLDSTISMKVKLRMVKRVWSSIKRWALRKALNNIGPNVITMSGPESLKNNNYSIHMIRGITKRDVVRKFKNEMLEFKTFDKNADDAVGEGCVNIKDVNLENIEITHYYKNYYTRYKGLNLFLIKSLTKLDVAKIELKLILGNMRQLIFNKKRLELKPRYELLELLIEEFGYHQESFYEFGVLRKTFSDRVIAHPKEEILSNKVKFYLESFVESGDLKLAHNGEYKVTGQALLTLEKFQLEEKRFAKMARLQMIIIGLTIVTAFSALVQANLISFS